ncbi:MAG TPA: ABC transporter transmembrane domain-containing protein [Thermoproteota archaeon]|nr:ABC transporter transmembrane domain-containing protein [Thermoproteota archaeon]
MSGRGSWGAFSTREEETRKRTIPDRVLMERLYGYAERHKRSLFIGMASIILTALTGLASPYLHELAIDKIIVPGDLSGFTWWIPIFVIVVIASHVFQYIQTYQMRLVGENVVSDMRDDMMEKLQSISLRYFSEGEIGRIISRPITDANTVRIFLRVGLTSVLMDASSIIGSFVMMYILDYRLATLALLTLPVSVLVVWYLGRYSRAAYRKAAIVIAGLTARMQEDLAGIKVIQSLVTEKQARARFERQQDDTVRVNNRATLIASSYTPLIMFLRLTGTVAILWYGTELFKAAGLTIGIIVAFTEYQFNYFMPIMDLMAMFDQYQSAMAAIERLFDLIDTKAEVLEAPPERRVELQ